jgi:hypothetical protein
VTNAASDATCSILINDALLCLAPLSLRLQEKLALRLPRHHILFEVEPAGSPTGILRR